MALVWWCVCVLVLAPSGAIAANTDPEIPDKPTAPSSSDNACTFCEVVSTMWSDSAVSDSDGPITTAKEKFCKELPTPLDTQCSDFVEKKGQGVLRLVQAGWTPQKICTQFNQCESLSEGLSPPTGGVEQNGHIDEDDMPSGKVLERKELVKDHIQLESHSSNQAGDEWSLLEVGTMTQGLSSSMGQSKKEVVRLWVSTYHVAYQWLVAHKTQGASKAAVAANSALQTEVGVVGQRSPFKNDAELFIEGILGNSQNFKSEHVDMLLPLVAHLESHPNRTISAPPAMEDVTLVSLEEQYASSPPDISAKQLADRAHDLASEVFNMQISAKLGGKGPLWPTVVRTWWSFIFTDYIFRQLSASE